MGMQVTHNEAIAWKLNKGLVCCLRVKSYKSRRICKIVGGVGNYPERRQRRTNNALDDAMKIPAHGRKEAGKAGQGKQGGGRGASNSTQHIPSERGHCGCERGQDVRKR